MKLSKIPKGRLTTSIVLAACTLGAAACSSSATAGATSPTTSASAGTGSASATGQVSLQKVTIGLLPLVGKGSEVLTQDILGIQDGAKALGWNVQEIDPNGSSQAMQSAMSTMINEHDAAIITLAIDAPLLGPELAAAKAAGIPVIDVNNQVDPATASEYSAEIAPSETEWGTILGDYMKQSLTPGPVIEEVNPPYTGHHEADVAMGIASSAGFTVAKVEETDLTNIVPSFQGVTREGLEAYPSAKYILVPGDFAPGIIKPILKLVNRGDVTILARYDDQPTIALMRQGVKIVDVTTNLYKPGLLALDQIASYVAHKTPVHTILGGPEFPFDVITLQNLKSYPSSGYEYTLASTLAPFVAEWSKEYKLS